MTRGFTDRRSRAWVSRAVRLQRKKETRIEKAFQKQAIAALIKIGFRLLFFFFIKLQNVIIKFFSIHLEGCVCVCVCGGGGAYNYQMYFLVYSREMGL